MNVKAYRSIGAVIAALAVIAVLAFVTDTTLQWIGVLPETDAKKFESKDYYSHCPTIWVTRSLAVIPQLGWRLATL
jgi:hypothetical protein